MERDEMIENLTRWKTLVASMEKNLDELHYGIIELQRFRFVPPGKGFPSARNILGPWQMLSTAQYGNQVRQ